ncbi:hypothetical protein JXB41_05325 [Candidatus Woesearchaeota archaeon]|nr:hypothetical protein [Candidatus Woesearchaeota archaeon]
MNKKLIINLFVLILLASVVNAFGIAPAHETIYFEPGLEKEITFRIINQDSENLRLAVYAKNELSEYVELPEDVIIVNKDEFEKIIKYKIRLPEKLTPGERKADILVMDLGEKESSENTILKANLGIIHQLRVIVPYPGQYLQGMLYISDTDVNKTTTFTISLFNLGKDNIDKIQGSLIIRDPNEQGISSLKTNSISLKNKENAKITSEWNADVLPGTYHVEAIIEYDDKILILEKDFDVGEPLLEIQDLTAYPFKLGTIAKFGIILKNKWNKDISDVYANTRILDDKGTEISQFTTEHLTLPAYSSKEITSYWDTKDSSAGDYLMEIKANYFGRVKEKVYELLVEEDKITVKKDQITGEVTGPGEKHEFNFTYVIIIIVLIAVTVILALKLRPKKPDKKTSYTSYKQTPSRQDSKLRPYIKKKLEQGFSEKALRKHLVEKGWSQEEIDEAMLEIEDEL